MTSFVIIFVTFSRNFAITEPLFCFDPNLNFENWIVSKLAKHENAEIFFFRIALFVSITLKAVKSLEYFESTNILSASPLLNAQHMPASVGTCSSPLCIGSFCVKYQKTIGTSLTAFRQTQTNPGGGGHSNQFSVKWCSNVIRS